MRGFCLYKAEGGPKMWLAGEINVEEVANPEGSQVGPDGPTADGSNQRFEAPRRCVTHLVYSVDGCGVKVFRTFAEALGVKQKLAGQGENVHISTDLPRRH